MCHCSFSREHFPIARRFTSLKYNHKREHMNHPVHNQTNEREFYQMVLGALSISSIDFLVGGGFALERYTGIQRDIKDCDIFVRRDDCTRVLDLFTAAGYDSKLSFPHWLGKITHDGYTVDIIFNSGNGTGAVDDDWFFHGIHADVLGIPVKLVPPEEMIHSKSYIMERERYDGADVAHLIHACGETMNWQRLVRRMGKHWKVLFSHVVLYSFAYPTETFTKVPHWLIQEFSRRFSLEPLESSTSDRVCNGTFLSRQQYLTDVRESGFTDGRLADPPTMSEEDIDRWTRAIGR